LAPARYALHINSHRSDQTLGYNSDRDDDPEINEQQRKKIARLASRLELSREV
jgi:hypothetical protein